VSSEEDFTNRRAPGSTSNGKATRVSEGQIGLFGEEDLPAAARPRKEAPRVAEQALELTALGDVLPRGLRYGTSSWSFPGWRGLVWDRDHSQGLLSRHGLTAYAQHPLLRAAGVDRTYYGPMSAASFAEYGEQVDDDFRFVVKAWQNITSTSLRMGPGAWHRNPDFLDAEIAIEKVVVPAIEGLEHRLGAIVFQFAPMPQRFTTRASGFATRLGEFLKALPLGPTYAVEVRNPEFYTTELIDQLGEASARLCLSVHPKSIALEEQAQLLRRLGDGPVVIRWMLKRDLEYASAKKRFAPFDRIQERDDSARESIARISQTEIDFGNDVTVIVNNKAEGSAPASIEALSRLMAGSAN